MQLTMAYMLKINSLVNNVAERLYNILEDRKYKAVDTMLVFY